MTTNIDEELKRRFLLQEEYLGTNKAINKITPLVSVTVITYQHADYIRKCLDGILMQKTKFPYEVIIGEDGSTDGTKEICKEYAEMHPDRIRLFLRDRNISHYKVGDTRFRFNGAFTSMSARGDYIAICEGDDHWTDIYKLKKQVDILEENKQYGMIYSKARIFNDKKDTYENEILGKTFDKEHFLTNPINPIPTLTTVFRNDLYQKYRQEVEPAKKGWKMGDYPIWLWFLFNSKIYYMAEVTATYRLLEESASHTKDKKKKFAFSQSAFDIANYFAKKYCNKMEYQKFLENRYLALYLLGVRYDIRESSDYLKKLQKQQSLSLIARFKIIMFHNFKIAYLMSWIKSRETIRSVWLSLKYLREAISRGWQSWTV